MNQTVAVTGATGFIGKYIIDNLLARGFHVRALTRAGCRSQRSGPLRRASARAQRRDFHPL